MLQFWLSLKWNEMNGFLYKEEERNLSITLVVVVVVLVYELMNNC